MIAISHKEDDVFFIFHLQDHTRLQRQVSELKSDLDSAQAMAMYCSQKMEHYLSKREI